jgi:hypothetical protein
MKREPSPADMKVLLNRWIDNEVLYREGLALGLDKGDTSIRERVIFKALSVTQAGLALPKIDEAGLRAWFGTRRSRYDIAPRFNFQEAVVSGEQSPESLRKFAAALNGQGQSDAQSSLRIFKDRPRDNIVQSYGAPFTEALEAQPPNTWAVHASSDGPRVIRLESITPGQVTDFEAVKDRVYQDWKDDTASQLTTQSVREMARKYRIRGDGFAL